MNAKEKLAKILFFVFIAIFSFTVLARKIPETQVMQNTMEHLEHNQNIIMAFSGASLGISLGMSALPNDFGNPPANTISNLNTYFVLLFAIIFVEKLIIIEGTKISLTYIIPAACILYIMAILTTKETFKNMASKFLILGISLIIVIPASTYFTEVTCDNYIAYVTETIEEANAGANKLNEIMSTSNEDATFFDKLSEAFKTSIQGIADLLTYFKNVIKKCVNSVAILIVTNCVLPFMMLLFFRWLLNELFALHIPLPKIQLRLPDNQKSESDNIESFPGEDET